MELALAWGFGDVTLAQVRETLSQKTKSKYHSSNAYSALALGLRDAMIAEVLKRKG